ncbi:hypothetical protein [Arthrobacter sp. R-11]|uniref:hypothetical protein n=1 Tax=Arthrobacter sp. R-11 TaxID=3404053 RepID=UPI003CF4D174
MSHGAEGLEELAVTLQGAAAKIIPEVRKVVSKGSLNVKRQIQKDFDASDHFGGRKPGGVAANVSYNLTGAGDGIESEIGPFVDSEGFGSLVGIALHGGSRGGGGTVADPLMALKTEEPRFIAALTDLAGKVLDG